MSDFYLQWLALILVQTAATMSPGPAFVVAVRNATVYGRKSGVFTALGLSLGVAAHVIFVLAGISFIISKSVILFSIIKYAGAAYLFYIGFKALTSKAHDTSGDKVGQTLNSKKNLYMSVKKALISGFLTNLLNPKAVVFFTAVYTQFIGVETPLFVNIVYGSSSIFIEFLWFATLSVFLTNSFIKEKFSHFMHYIEKLCGGLMIALGAKLALLR
tara:strand:+ start:1856 stop:2500 length:645 start_codon:yes stop_codon:yes gene_type:complete